LLGVRRAANVLQRADLIVDGDMQADTAVNDEIQNRIFPFSELQGEANILIFPNLESSNIAYKLIQQIGKVEVLGPFIMGIRKSANVLQRTTTVDGIFNSVVMTTLEAQYIKTIKEKKAQLSKAP
jgi:malate dehydrogenase (oxaloacetate-decarboxylating)(NADP+)